MTIPRALIIIALVVSASCVMVMLAAGRTGTLAGRLALTEPASGESFPAPDDLDTAP